MYTRVKIITFGSSLYKVDVLDNFSATVANGTLPNFEFS